MLDIRLTRLARKCLNATEYVGGTRTYATQTKLNIRQISGALGAEISDMDLNAISSQGTIDAIRSALLDHQVIFFRGQDLDPASYLRFAKNFGTAVRYPFAEGIDGHPEVVNILKRENEHKNFGSGWHSDTSYLEQPPMGSILMALEVPPYGGDTIFVNQSLAYDALSPRLKEILCSLKAINTSHKASLSAMQPENAVGTVQKVDVFQAAHPVIRTHPETGRKSLFVNEVHTSHFEGLTSEESAPLLHYLYRHQTRPEFTCRFRWSVGSVAFWDNRCTQHYPINDYDGYRRSMWRIILEGDRPK